MRNHLFITAALAVMAWSGAAEAANPWLTIDLPGSNGVFVNFSAISGHETIIGYYSNGTSLPAFMRTPDGVITTFQVNGLNAQPTAIDLDGDIVGSYIDGNAGHGFLRMADGTTTTLDVPGAESTGAIAINNSGQIGGSYNLPGSNNLYGYLRLTDGTYKTFGIPDQAMTWVTGINKHGALVGYYGQNAHGFIRGCGGKITTFDVPGGQRIIDVVAINDNGDVAGDYFRNGSPQHGYIRHADGSFETFDAPGANPDYGTYVAGMNNDGNLIGTFFIGNVQHGFARAADGTITVLDNTDPTALETIPTAIGPSGKIIGVFKDRNNKRHGFRLNAAGAGF